MSVLQGWPRQDIPFKDRNETWYRQMFDYAAALLKNSNARIDSFTKLYNAYNGKIAPLSVEYLTKTYGKNKTNRTKYVDYRVGRPKIDLICNEFLLQPLEGTVYTINADSRTAKLEQYEMIQGAVAAKPHIEKLRQNGIDPLEGMDIPDNMDTDTWKKMSPKDKNEILMQTILNVQIPKLRVKEKLWKCRQDTLITSMAYGRIYVDENGDEQIERIDPRNAVYEEIENDTFMKKSPLMGHREFMPVHNILMSFNLTKDQRDRLEIIRNKQSEYLVSQYKDYYRMRNGAFCADVIFME